MLVSYSADFNKLFKVSSQVCPIGCNIILDIHVNKVEPKVRFSLAHVSCIALTCFF